MDTEILEDIGLTKAEIKVYISLLELGNSSAGPILEKSGLQNSVVHRALNSLIGKGLISFILEGKRRIYQATDPENFYDFIDNKKRRFEEILPELKEKQHFAKDKAETTIYKGKKGINEIYARLLREGKGEYNTFGGGERVSYDVMGRHWWKNLHARIKANRIKARQVFDETIREFGEELKKISGSDIRYFPREYEQLQETVIRDNLVAINIFTENAYGILIKDNEVVEGYRKYFEMMWRRAEK